MVHIIVKVKGGYKVRDKNALKYYSKEPLTKETAKKQLTAISISSLKSGKHKSWNKK
jgi:hypothetical protein